MQAKKNLGQNFLNNHETLTRIISAADLNKNDQVIEIGPGHGILTAELIKNAGNVTSIELDSDLIPELAQKFAQEKNFQLINRNALAATPPKTPYKLVANIPYYITSPVINHFLREQPPESRPTLIVLLVQKEVAQKICAQKGDLSVLAIQVQLFGRPEIIATIPAQHFTPTPKVDSAIIKIKIHPSPIGQENLKEFFTLVNVGFSHRRKKLINNLAQLANTGKDDLEKIFGELGLKETVRAQELSIQDWVDINNKRRTIKC